ncbi:MAG: Hsp20/alpha crystallin family protein [Gammaproteobacteria bacterium]|nr:Hsp20/alpha crystallin family protein [Gammaproteobacteria bacterium]
MAKRSTSIPVHTHGENRVFHPLATLRHEAENVFDRFSRGWQHFRSMINRPRADASESKDDYEISMELPGMDEGDIELTMADGVLYMRGEKRHEYEERDRDYYVMERAYGVFRRAFQIPDDVDSEKIHAKFGKGVLTISFPRSIVAKKNRRKIRVKAS